MNHYFGPALRLARLQFMRILRDPVGTIILFGLPMVLLVVFGAFTGNTDSLSLDLALVNESTHDLSATVGETMHSTGVFEFSEAPESLESALEMLREGDLDAVVYLPADFGESANGAIPTGTIELFIDESRGQTGDIARSVLNGMVLELNQRVVGVDMPLSLVQRSVLGDNVQPISFVFALFAALGMLMMGVFGAASLIPMDRKTGVLRRLHAMPISGGQLLIGTMLSFGILAALLLSVMTATAVLAFDMPMPDSTLLYAGFAGLAIVMLVGLGFAISGISKTPSQADVYGQVVFFGSLALGGVWVPQAFMPDVVRTISRGVPLTPVIDGLQAILHGTPGIVDLLPQIAVIAVWILITYTVGIRTFRWE
ncbi:MAG: ABC transporter permease [Spirochaetaceae bacterium]